MEMFEHNTSTFIGKGGVEIFFQNWKKTSPDGIFIIVHGIGEHSGRYRHILEHLQDMNVSVYAMDHRGHGKSAGRRGHVDSFMDYVYDLKLFRNYITEENDGTPVFMFGHSLGGVVALRYALEYPEDLRGLILSSPGLIPSVEVSGWKKTLASITSSGLGSLTMSNGISTALLSHDSDEVADYENDPLVHDRISSRLYSEMMKTSQECLNRVSEITIPMLLLHGKDDCIADISGSEKVFQNASSTNKEFYVFDGLYHEIINEIKEDRDRVLGHLTSWLSKQLSGKAAPGKRGRKPGVKMKPAAAAPKTPGKRGRKPGVKVKPAAKKTAKKKTAAKKAAPKKSAPKKAAPKKAAPKKTAPKKTTPKKAAPKKTAPKKSAAKKGRKKA